MTTKELLGQAKIYAEGRADALKQVKEHYSDIGGKSGLLQVRNNCFHKFQT